MKMSNITRKAKENIVKGVFSPFIRCIEMLDMSDVLEILITKASPL
jgi:hypothetical protein